MVDTPPTKTQQWSYALISIALGISAFIKVNQISGPAFEPILAACNDKSIPVSEFATRTGYHEYEPRVGFVAFNWLVCLITQFLLELRETYPQGVLVWGGVIVVSLPTTILSHVEAGRGGARGLVRYPMAIGLLYQLFGVSVMFPMVWVPSYIFGRGDGIASSARSYGAVLMMLPGVILTIIVFLADTEGYLWTVSAGTLGGPLIVMFAAVFWLDVPPSVDENTDKGFVDGGVKTTATCYLATVPLAIIGWIVLVYIAYTTYGFDVAALWDAIWTHANPSVAFMTVDTIVLHLSVLLYIAYRDVTLVGKALLYTPFAGPGAACSIVMAGMELNRINSYKKVD